MPTIDPGFSWSDVVTQLNALLSNSAISALIVGIIAIGIAGMVIDLFKRTIGRG